jgi:hypothetical protein
MPHILLITNSIAKIQPGGRELLSKLNHDILQDIFGSQLIVAGLVKVRIRTFKTIIKSFNGHIDGINDSSIDSILTLIKSEKIDLIFIDGSNLGEICKVIKFNFPKIKICTFFHNVEARFFLGSLMANWSFHAVVVLFINYLSERKAIKYSNSIICLSDRDSKLLYRIYGRLANFISPMALHDKLNYRSLNTINSPINKYILFVGSGFYANRDGISWYCKHVAPFIKNKTYIVGSGLEDLKLTFIDNVNIEFVGSVDNLNKWYLDAHIVVAPIFDGSGMKTKVAEALMYGKRIVGTAEAFSGYEVISNNVGWLCNSANDFIAAINEADLMDFNSYNSNLRNFYDENYSFPAAKSRMISIIESILK